MSIESTLTPWRDWAGHVAGNPFRLACRLGPPADEADISDAWRELAIPPGMKEFWLAAQRAELFVDVDFGQWGLRLLSPSASRERTATELELRPGAFSGGDAILGEFLGDQDLLVVESGGEILIAMPLDDRPHWPRPASNLEAFLKLYTDRTGEKYWESPATDDDQPEN